jgi:hypothetical protein
MVCFGIYQTIVINSLSTPESVVLLSNETRLDSFSSNENKSFKSLTKNSRRITFKNLINIPLLKFLMF